VAWWIVLGLVGYLALACLVGRLLGLADASRRRGASLDDLWQEHDGPVHDRAHRRAA
jgi:hypothetical protein